MENMMGKCEFCGNEFGVMAETQEEANSIAAQECQCAGVRIARKKEKMKENLSNLIGKNCSLEFMPVEQTVYDAIETIGLMIVDNMLHEATFKVDGTIISLKNGRKIKVTRRRVYERGGEIEE